MASLYDINKAILEFEFEVNEDGEILNADALDALEIERDEKIENIALYIKNLLSDAEQFKAEKEAFAEREKAAKTHAERLKRYLADALQGEKFETTRAKISWRRSTQLEIADGAKIPAVFYNQVDPVLDKTRLKAAVKSGTEFDGVSLVEKQNIQIK